MKKVLALVLAAVMALSLAATASALVIIPGAPATDPAELAVPATFFFGGDGETYTNLLMPGALVDEDDDVIAAFVPDENDASYFAIQASGVDPDKYTVSATVSSSKPDVLKATITTKTDNLGVAPTASKGTKLTLKLDPADEYFTVEEHKVDVKIIVVQKESKPNGETIKSEVKIEGIVVKNKFHDKTEFYADANDKVVSVAELSNPVITADVFTDVADGKALVLDYGKYTVKFAKVTKQNTALYLKAKTDVVSVENTKAIGSIGFKPTRIKDAATITMPINPDNENFYGETVYVYTVVDGKPTGEAIAAEVVNHNSIIFTVPAGTTLGTFAAYGAKTEGDAEKPAIPETGANDIVNIAIVFAVVALAAAGFVAVKKASK